MSEKCGPSGEKSPKPESSTQEPGISTPPEISSSKEPGASTQKDTPSEQPQLPGSETGIINQQSLGFKVSDAFMRVVEVYNEAQTDEERIDCIYNALEPGNDFIPDEKSHEKAVSYRQQGNERFAKGEFLQAAAYYTHSIRVAKAGDDLALTYANRSAALYKLNMHAQCIVDIDRALNNNYPDNLKPKLLERRENSVKLETPRDKYYEDIPEIPEASRNQKIEVASDCIEIVENEKFGRHIVATRDIKVGEVLFVEKAFTTMLSSESFFHCHDCLELCYNLIPCDSCTQVLYCSQKCKEMAFKNYHQYECPTLLSINALFGFVLQFITLSLKMTYLTINENFDELSVEDVIWRSGRYKEIHNLLTHNKNKQSQEFFTLCFTVAQMFAFVKKHTTFFNDFNVENNETKFKELLLLHLQIFDINNTEVVQIERRNLDVYENVNIGCAIYSFYSLFNHSCYPNVVLCQHGTTLVMRSAGSIRKGEQCFTSYGELYVNDDKETRQKKLLDKYSFICECRACVQDWPAAGYVSDNFRIYLNMKEELVHTADPKTAKAYLPQLIKKLRRVERTAPCPNVNLLRDIIADCYHSFGNKRRV